MTPRPTSLSPKLKDASLVRSCAAEYLTFIAASGQGGVEAIYADESIWLTQKMMGQLYDIETHTVNYHLKKVFSDNELLESSVIRKFRITAADGKSYDTQHYHLSAIIAVGYKVNSERAVQFRRWATGVIGVFFCGRRCLNCGQPSRHNLAHDRYEYPRNCRHGALARTRRDRPQPVSLCQGPACEGSDPLRGE